MRDFVMNVFGRFITPKRQTECNEFMGIIEVRHERVMPSETDTNEY